MSGMSHWNENSRNIPGNDICWYYTHGGCHYGNSCWFVHENGSSTPTNNATMSEYERKHWESLPSENAQEDSNNKFIATCKSEFTLSKNLRLQLKFDVSAMNISNDWKFKHFTDEEIRQQIEAENTEEEETQTEEAEESVHDDSTNPYDSDNPFQSDEDVKFDPDDYFTSRYDIYKKDDVTPEIVSAAMSTDLQRVRKYIALGGDLDKRRRWTEVQEKWGYDKSWEWVGDSALIVAARKGSVEIVKELLLHQADPMLESCPCDDQYNKALDVAKNNKIIQMITVVNNLWSALNPNCHESAHYKSERKAKKKPDMKLIQKAISNLL